MKFWQSFSKKQIKKQLFFGIALFALMIPLAIRDSNTQVKVNFDDAAISIRSDRYNMSVRYDQIAYAELAELVDPGEKVEDAYDDNVLRVGAWYNDTWGEYYITADPDTDNCVVMHLDDGRIFVFSCKNDDKTAKLYEELLTYLN